MLFNDDLQKGGKKYLEAKANETKFDVFQKKVLFGITIIFLVVFAVVIVICLKEAFPGVQNFMKHLR